MTNAAIVGTGWHVPEEIIPNSFFDDGEPWYFYDRDGNRIPETDPDKRKISPYKHTFLTDDKIRQISGVQERRMARPDEYVHDLVVTAAEMALDDAGMSPHDLDGIIIATVTAKTNFPSAAHTVQEMLDAKNVRDAGDINYACAGFPKALDIARRYVAEGKVFLVAGAETLTKITDYEGRDVNANLFGDGAGVAILAPIGLRKGVLEYDSRSDPHKGKLCYITRDPQGLLRMGNGPAVLKNAVASMADVTTGVLGKSGWRKSEVDYFVFHQANNRITEKLTERLDANPARVGNNIARFGNMSAATNPILLSQALHDGRIQPGYKVIMASFGAGLVTAGVAIKF